MKLQTQTREAGRVSVKKLREDGFMPMVSYGPKEDATSLAVKVRDFKHVWKEAGETTVVTLVTGDEETDALIHEVSVHPVTGEPIHVDFYVMEKGKKVEVTVPLAYQGEAPAVTDLDGTLVKVLHEIDVEALPKDLPNEIVVDISALKELEDTITVGDIKVSEGVTIQTPADETIVSITVQEEEPEEPEEEVDFAEAVEVEQKGKDEEGENEEGTPLDKG